MRISQVAPDNLDSNISHDYDNHKKIFFRFCIAGIISFIAVCTLLVFRLAF